mgnify:CR=1 FL=1
MRANPCQWLPPCRWYLCATSLSQCGQQHNARQLLDTWKCESIYRKSWNCRSVQRTEHLSPTRTTGHLRSTQVRLRQSLRIRLLMHQTLPRQGFLCVSMVAGRSAPACLYNITRTRPDLLGIGSGALVLHCTAARQAASARLMCFSTILIEMPMAAATCG